MKEYLLIAGHNYYPSSGSEDWIGCYDTHQEAEDKVKRTTVYEYFTRGPRKGLVKSTRLEYKVNGEDVDWYQIVNLGKWIK